MAGKGKPGRAAKDARPTASGVEQYTNDAIIAALKKTNGLITIAAQALGCDPTTIYRRIEKVPEVRAAIEDARENLTDIAELKMRQAILNGESWAVAFVAKTLGRKRGFVERQEYAGVSDQPLTFRVVRDDPPAVDDGPG